MKSWKVNSRVSRYIQAKSCVRVGTADAAMVMSQVTIQMRKNLGVVLDAIAQVHVVFFVHSILVKILTLYTNRLIYI